jgi:RNA polymerase sigma factor (sigma-70 family)
MVCMTKTPKRFRTKHDAEYEADMILQYTPLVHKFVGRFLRTFPLHEREDYISAGFEALLRAIRDYDETKGASFLTWAWQYLNMEMRKTAQAAYRRRRHDKQLGLQCLDFDADGETRSRGHDYFVDPKERFPEIVDQREYVEYVLSQVTTKQRAVLELYYFDGLKLKQIAAILGVTFQRVQQIRNDAFKAVRDAAEREKQNCGMRIADCGFFEK